MQRQLKDWIKMKQLEKNSTTNIILKNYMMERLLERIAVSEYRENVILKRGFLITAMFGIDRGQLWIWMPLLKEYLLMKIRLKI